MKEFIGFYKKTTIQKHLKERLIHSKKLLFKAVRRTVQVWQILFLWVQFRFRFSKFYF